jgi:hypothetical protein
LKFLSFEEGICTIYPHCVIPDITQTRSTLNSKENTMVEYAFPEKSRLETDQRFLGGIAMPI